MCLQEVELERQCDKACKTLTKMKIQEQRGRKVQAIQCKALTQGNNKKSFMCIICVNYQAPRHVVDFLKP